MADDQTKSTTDKQTGNDKTETGAIKVGHDHNILGGILAFAATKEDDGEEREMTLEESIQLALDENDPFFS